MQLNIHLILVGLSEPPLLRGIQVYDAVDKVYLLHSEKSEPISKKIKQKFQNFGIKQISLRKIDIFSIDSIVNTITDIAQTERQNKIFINITGGTNLMAAAACATSYFIGAQAYYIKDDRQMPSDCPAKELLIELPIPNIQYDKKLGKKQLQILKLIDKRRRSSHKLIWEEMHDISHQDLSYHIRQLIKKKLIVEMPNKTDSRLKDLVLTDVGKLMISWSPKI